jgi:hypothetical protein
MSLSLFPVSPIDISVWMDHHSPPIELSIFCLTCILGSILEENRPKSHPFDKVLFSLFRFRSTLSLREIGDIENRVDLLNFFDPLTFVLSAFPNVHIVIDPRKVPKIWRIEYFINLLLIKK